MSDQTENRAIHFGLSVYVQHTRRRSSIMNLGSEELVGIVDRSISIKGGSIVGGGSDPLVTANRSSSNKPLHT